MNAEKLQIVFEDYIRIFESVNSGELNSKSYSNESYKWAIASSFRKEMDSVFSAENDVAECLSNVKKLSKSFFESEHEQALSGMIEISKREPETVRKLLCALCKEEQKDVREKEKQIDRFVATTNSLIEKYFPSSYKYPMSFKTALNILALYNPEDNYLYKPDEMKDAAKAIEYSDEWGSGNNINLKVYYRMCDEIFEAIKTCPELIEKNNLRFERYKEAIHPYWNTEFGDKLLVFDIMFSCGKYGKGLDQNFVNCKLRYNRAYAEYKKLCEAQESIGSFFSPGKHIISKAYGKGVVTAKNGDTVEIYFEERDITKKLGFMMSAYSGILWSENDDFKSVLQSGKTYLAGTKQNYISNEMNSARKALKPYSEYLEKYGEKIM